MEAALRRFFGWVFRNPLTALLIVAVLGALFAGPAIEALIMRTTDSLLAHVVLPLVPLAVIFWIIYLMIIRPIRGGGKK